MRVFHTSGSWWSFTRVWVTASLLKSHPGLLSIQQLHGHSLPISKTIQVRWTKYLGPCWRSKEELTDAVLLWVPTHGRASVRRLVRTYLYQLCAETLNIVWKTCQERWMIGTHGEKEAGKFVLSVRLDDDDILTYNIHLCNNFTTIWKVCDTSIFCGIRILYLVFVESYDNCVSEFIL